MTTPRHYQRSFNYRVAVRRLSAVSRELITASMAVAFLVTPPDVVAMLYAAPPILLALSVAYVVGGHVALKETSTLNAGHPDMPVSVEPMGERAPN